MTENNLIVMDAPVNSSGITIEGVAYEVDNGQALIPSHLIAEAFIHGFKISADTKDAPQVKPAIPEKAEESVVTQGQDDGETEKATAPEKASGKKK